jgi:orotate phosphoribosyltransferase
MPNTAVRQRLLDLLVTHSYQRAADERFVLTSGKRSNYYVNCKTTTMRGEALPLIGELVAEHLPASTEGIGGLTLGADAIAGAAVYYCQTIGRAVNWFTVRKQAKQHGTQQFIEGVPGARVLIVDDVVTTGGSTIDAIRKCRAEGKIIDAVVVLVDRQEGGMEGVRAEAGSGVPVHALFERAELEARWQDLQKTG